MGCAAAKGGGDGSSEASSPNRNGSANLRKGSPTLNDQDDNGARLPGKEKYIKSYGAIVMEERLRGGNKTSVGMLILFCARETDDLTFSYRDNTSGAIFARRFTTKELQTSKEAAGIPFPWGPFFKSLASDMLRSKVAIEAVTFQTKEISFTILSSKEPEVKYAYRCSLDLVSGPGAAADRGAVFEYFVEPMTRMLRVRRCNPEPRNVEARLEKLECDYTFKSANVRQCKAKVGQLLAEVRPLREMASMNSQNTMKLATKVKTLKRRLYALYNGPSCRHPLDVLYEDGGAQCFEHSPYAEEHRPIEEEMDQAILACIRAAFPLPPGAKLDSVSHVLDRPELQARMNNSNRQLARDMFDIFRGVDRWDYDTIQLDILTNGNALFYTTYMLMYKLDLVSHFHLDDGVLQRFLVTVQAGYHPNPYHNAMHAADVTQINYYIMMVAGLKEKCQLSPEEILASLLAGAIHDFDHPGLNNNFHTKTNAYLSTLYNDRSVLENHHVACIFELVQNPAYNVFAPLSAEQLRVVRETMIEMVLATDMGNHARIFNSFRVRMSETTDWHTLKEDVRLALSMSIKMADISNCARPNYIYAEWARNIAQEFYNQGDIEAACNFPISPFMDRSKEITDFPKGQISFMMYIVVPMVEAMSQFLPSLCFALQHCNENKEAWQSYQEGRQ